MTQREWIALVGAVLVAAAMWAFMFRLHRDNIWPRTWVAAAVVSAYALGATAALGDVGRLVGRISATEVGLGLVVGGAWLVATHAGAAVLGRVMPSFLDEIADLYRLAEHDRAARMAGPLVAMAIAEELLFRGLIQGRAGLAVAVAIYAAVQIIEGKRALVVAAALGGLVWGALFAWRHGLVAPIVAHATWTLVLTLLWPIGPGHRRTDAARISGPSPA